MVKLHKTASEIAQMTPPQMIVFFNYLNKREGSGDTLHFDTEEQYLEWLTTTRRSH